MNSLLNTKWVFFKEDNRTHEEVFVQRVRDNIVETTDDIEETLDFETADEAYRFGNQHQPFLNDWHVGIRNGRDVLE